MLPLASTLLAPASLGGETLRIAPYLQLGADDGTKAEKSLTLLWFGPRGGAVTYDWGRGSRRAAATRDGVRWRAVLSGLPPGASLRYTIADASGKWFSSNAVSPAGRGQSYSAAVFGDTGRGTPAQWRLAKTLGREALTLLVHTGDIVYPKGTESDYLKYHFPVYNAEPGAARGISLLRRIVTAATPGNHDTLFRSPALAGKGGLAYYRFWDQPDGTPRGDEPLPAQRLAEKTRGNFSFAWGPSWWVVLDSNPYRRWDTPDGRAWIARQLGRGAKYAWRFVVFHHAPFFSGDTKSKERYMDRLADAFTAGKADVVFAGHAHNAQRSFPLRASNGSIALDRAFRSGGRANGTIYVVSGAGGAELYDQRQLPKRSEWRPFTAAFSPGYSFTRLSVSPSKVSVAQVGIGGKTLDSFEIGR